MLEKNGFDLGSTLENGVPYLNREEQSQVFKEMFQEKQYEHIDPETIGTWAVKFYHDLREEIQEWLRFKEDTVSYIWSLDGISKQLSNLFRLIGSIKSSTPKALVLCERQQSSWSISSFERTSHNVVAHTIEPIWL